MIELDTASAAKLWGSGLDSAGTVANAAERMAGRVLDSGSNWQELAAGSTPVLVALAVGLALWLVGDRLFRPASSLVGAGIGALFGLWASTVIQAETLGNVPTAYVTIGLGSLAGLAIGAAMYRIAIGTVGGLAFGCAAAALTIAISLQGPTGAPSVPDRPETIAEAAARRDATPRPAQTGGTVIPASFDAELSAGDIREAASATASSVGALVRAEWAAVPDSLQPLALGAAILGCVVGFAAGLLKPRTVGPAVAALAGAALWLGATTVLLARAGNAPLVMPADRPLAWFGAWLGVAVLGFIVQRRVGRPKALLAGDS